MASDKRPSSDLGKIRPEEEEYARRFTINSKYLTDEFRDFIQSGIEGERQFLLILFQILF